MKIQYLTESIFSQNFFIHLSRNNCPHKPILKLNLSILTCQWGGMAKFCNYVRLKFHKNELTSTKTVKVE